MNSLYQLSFNATRARIGWIRFKCSRPLDCSPSQAHGVFCIAFLLVSYTSTASQYLLHKSSALCKSKSTSVWLFLLNERGRLITLSGAIVETFFRHHLCVLVEVRKLPWICPPPQLENNIPKCHFLVLTRKGLDVLTVLLLFIVSSYN